ncbi:RUN and SH3 domain containing 1 isoform X1 [Chaetodon auriga]|uniref:RUN and SH3 domain containing 1 isoform X1 n=1 Tax=Chaetodon auriga TaxID=39042 RepID=UPI004032DE09
MQSSSCASQPPKPRRFDVSRRTNTLAAPKSHGPGFQREDKNMNTITTSSPRRATKGPTAPTRSRVGVQPRAPVSQSRFGSQKQVSTISKSAKPKPKSARASAATKIAPAAAPPPLPSVLPLDPNCNEPSLPCLCCDGRSPQDNNSMFNHNHNNNNTISLRQQLQLPPPPALLPQRQDGKGAKEQPQPPLQAQAQLESSACPAASLENEGKNADESIVLDNKKNVKVEEEDDEEESSGDIDIDDDEEEADNDDDDEDDDTLVPSCCDGPPSLLEFSLSSSTSSSSTSISSCSDLESDCADQSASICSSQDQDNLSVTLSPKDHSLPQAPECQPPARSPPSLPISRIPFHLTSCSPIPPCSPDEGYPSALDSPSPDYLGVKGDSEVTKLGLLDFLESVGEFGKMERFSQVIQVARWDLEGEQHWDVLRDWLDHLDRLEKVNREVKLAYVARLHEKGFDLGDLEEQDLSDVMDEMGNIDIPWKLYKSHRGTMGDSQEFSDAGVDLTAPSDCDEPLAPDSLTPSPVEPPPRPPKPPARHASVSSDLHTYINISRETTSMAVSTSPTLSTFSVNSSSPTFTTFRCEKPPPASPPSIPPLPTSKPVPYLTLYTTPSPPTSIPTPTPPIPPPRRRHLARKEAQRLAALQAEQEKTPLSLPPPTTRPPPLPPPPVISVSSSSPPAIPPPPALPPPPSFHALDVEIRKLLMLAGLTQAELLKLSPELGVCVGGLEDEGDGDDAILSRSAEPHEFRLRERGEEERQRDTELMARDGKLDGDRRVDVAEEGKKKEESKDTQRTTSFTEMARRRKRNSGLTTDSYYSTAFSNTHETKAKNMSFESFQYPAGLPDSPPPPPPPRPLPPIPPSLPPVKVSTLPANSAQPERFDWLIAFTPDCDAPPQPPPLEMRKSQTETQKKLSSSGSSPELAPKVTTFKEMRFRNKSASPPTKVITDPDPDPTVITPDPDILYNLRWRREKAGGDGNQWEYTSQAQAFFMQPPPALTSMAALKEMLQRADKEGGQLELCPSQKIGCSVSDNSLWTMGREWECEEKSEEKEGKEEKEEEEVEVEVRGRADGGGTFESRTSVSSPPLSLTQSSQPYFLHTALPSYRPGYCNSQPFADPRPHNHVGRESTDEHCNTQRAPAASSACTRRDDSSSDLSAWFEYEPVVDFGVDSPCDNGNIVNTHRDFASDSMCNFDSLYCSDSEKQNGAHTKSDTPVRGTTEAAGCTTPYKNIDVMMTYSNSVSAMDSLHSQKRIHSHTDHNSNKARTFKELPPLPTYYLYHPKNCPLHRGAPPRLSPIGALSPPQRSGAPPPGAAGSGLSSPLFPRSHTLPALAAPLYYPNLYPPIPPRAPPLPPKLYQAPPQSRVATVRSVSFAGSVQRTETSWMGEDVKHPVRGLGLSSLCLQEKKALVSAVSVAVEAILAQFSSSRTVVQKFLSVNKALSGDSTINPSLGRLVLQCLCPALHSLLTDGLKPHQSDLIAGRRPNSAWGLVQASTRPGPKTQALFNLQVRVGELPQLRQSKHRFNAFLLGLLNTKLLDFWLSHLQSCSDVLETYFHPTAFMRLSLASCQPLFEELLLVLQPLSLLTFNLDLLFQHHHLEPDSHSPEIPSPPCQDAGFQLSTEDSQSKIAGCRYIESLSEVDFGSPEYQAAKEKLSPLANPKNGGSEESTHSSAAPMKTSPQLLWVQEKEIGELPPPDIEEDSLAQQAGQVIQQGWGAVMRWGGRLSQNLAELSLKKEEMRTDLPDLQVQAGSDFAPVSSAAQVPWGLGRLFGASKSPNSPPGHTPPTRRPSQWLAPGVTALTRMVSSSSTPIIKRAPKPQGESEPEPEKDVDALEMKDKPRPLRSVRTLCDHTGSGSELSFCKGEELVVLGGVDQDWIRCRQGDKEGLVPIGYTSLIM